MKRLGKLIVLLLVLILILAGCSSVLGINSSDKPRPISNPFSEYGSRGEDRAQNMILRTKKGDRSVELEIPGDQEHLSDFVLPVSPAFKDSSRAPASVGGRSGTLDESYKDRESTFSDREITQGFPKGSTVDEARRRDIEKGLNLAPDEETFSSETEKTPSYLAAVDRIKQLYRMARYEAALIETDQMIRVYQTDPRLHEMRGTLLDRLGKRDLALQSWSQSLKLRPENPSLRRFVERKQLTRQLSSSPGAP